MKTFKRIVSSMLALVLVFTTFCFTDLGLTANAWVDNAGVEMIGRPEMNFFVPETVYLDASGNFQYFVDSDQAGDLNRNPAKTTGQLTFSSSTAFEDLVITRSDTSTTYGVSSRSTKFNADVAGGTHGTGGSVITWTAKYTVDNVPYESHAYTYIYQPFTGMIGSGFKAQTSELWTTHTGERMEINVLTGFHSYNSAKGGYKWGGSNTGVKTPWEIAIGTDRQGPNDIYGNQGPSKDESKFLTSSSTDNYFAFSDYGNHSDIDQTQDINTVSAGNLAIDSSRYTNTDQIPNLQAAAYTTYMEWCNPTDSKFETGANESISDYPTSFTRFYDTTDYKTDSGDGQSRYSSTRVSATVPPAGIAAPTAGNTKSYQLWVKQYAYQKYDGTLDNQYIEVRDMTRLNVTMVNKSALRALYRQCCGLAVEQTNSYGTAYTNEFLTALNSAGRALGDPTATTAVTNAYNGLSSALSGLHLTTTESGFNTPNYTFYVPETIYLKPDDRKTFEYYVDSTSSGALNTAQNKTGGLVYFDCPDATSVDVVCSGATVTASGLTGKTTTVNTTVTGGSVSTAVAAGGTSTISWTATFVVDGTTYTATSYTVLYAPMTTVTAAAVRVRNTHGWGGSNQNFMQSLMYAFGFHSYTANGAYDTVSPLDDIFSARRAKLTKADGTDINNNSASDWLTDQNVTKKNANYGSEVSGSSNNGTTSKTITGPDAAITVDASRYTNFSQIPNLSAGWAATDDQYSTSQTATVTCTYGTGKVTTMHDIPWENGNPEDKPLNPTQISGAIADNNTNKLELYGYACSKDEDWNDTGDKAENKLYLTINVTKVNKADLRTDYRKAVMSGRCAGWYTTASWNNYLQKLQNAGTVLGDPTRNSAQIDTARTELNQSIADLVFLTGTATESHLSTAAGNKELESTTITYNYGDTLSAGHNDYDGYTYKGYEMTVSGETPVIATTSGTDPATLDLITKASVSYTFYYQPNTYTVTYDPNGGTFNGTTDTSTNTATYDAAYKVGMNKAAPTKTGYVFVDWQISGVSDTQLNGDSFTWKYVENKTFTARWEENQYTLIYHINDGTSGSDYTFPALVNYTLTLTTERNGGGNINAERTGYRFMGWNTKRDGTGTNVQHGSPVTISTIATEQGKQNENNATIYLYANWAANIYTLHYDANAGGATLTGQFPGDQQCKASETVVLDAGTAFSWPGHRFLQWNSQDDGSGTPYNQGGEYGALSQTHDATVTLYAIWETLYYDVTFEEDNGSTVTDLTHKPYNTTMEFPTSTKAGYKDLTWYDNPNFTGTGYTPGTTKKITASVTYYAKWTREVYTLSCDAAGGTFPEANPTTYHVETPSFTLKNPVRTGYVFEGWAGSNGSTPEVTVVIPKGSTGDRYYTAVWHLDTYTITYDLKGGSLPDGVTNPTSYTYDSATITLNAPVRPGWTFLGWTGSNGNSASTVVVIQHNSTGPKSYTANWQSNTYYVDYLPAPTGAQIDNMPNRQTLLYKDDNAIVSDTIPIRDGYDFVCWNTKADGTGTNYSGGDTLNETKPTADGGIINLYPRWTPSTFTVKWNLAGGTLNGSSTVADTTVTYLGNYTIPKGTFFKSSYRIVGDGWFDAETGGNAITDTTQVTKTDKIHYMYAHWENAEYTVAFDANGGTGTMNSILATCNVPFQLPSVGFTRPGYNFVGWATTRNGAFAYGDGDNVTTNMTDRDGVTVTLYARWEGRAFRIAYNLNGGAGTMMASNITMANTDGIFLREYKLGTQEIDNSQYEFYGWAYTKAQADAMTVAYTNKAIFVLNDEELTRCTVDWDAANPTITLYAIWARHTTVTWKLEGGMLDGSKDDITTEVIYGQNYVLPTGTYARSRFQFIEWRTLPQGGGTRVDGDTILLTNEDTNVYAFWNQTNPDLYTNYQTEYYLQNADTGEYPAQPTETVTSRALVDSEVNADQKSYYGYTLDQNAANVTSGQVLDNEELDGNGNPKMLILKLYYKANVHTLSFNANSGTGTMAPISFKYGEAFHLPANTFQKLGYSFGGWKKDNPDATNISYGDENEFTGPDSDVNLYAKWTMVTYTLTTNPTGGTLATANPENYTVETATFTLNNPTRTGYTFLGWTGSNGDTPQTSVTIAKGSTGNKNYAAVWEADVYNLSYDIGEGTIVEENPETYTIESPTFTLNNPIRTGYTFDGWTGSNGETPQTIVTILLGSTGERNFYANWTADTYTISCDLKGGSLATANPENYTIETATFTLNNPTRTGYIFTGWTGSNSSDTPQTTVTIAKGSTGNKSYTANWSPITYAVAFDANGGEGTMPSVSGVAYDTEITLPDSTFTRTGHTFQGWALSTDATEYEYRKNQKVSNLTAEDGATVTLYAFWSVNAYTITFDSAGGSPVDPITLPFGTEVTAPQNPTREGYSFDGWSPAIPETMPAKNQTLTATWHPNAITVTFYRNGGTEGTDMDPITVNYGEEVHLPKCTFQKTGYHFVGWSRTADGAATIGDENAITGGVNNVDLFAVWAANKYYVEFRGNGATDGSMDTLECVYDDSYTLSANEFTKTGARFLGWALSANGEVVYNETNNTITNLTTTENGRVPLFAIWENIHYTITFDGNGATTPDKVPQPKDVIYNQQITLPTAEGMTIYSDEAAEKRSFMGWVTADNTSYAPGAQFTAPAANVTIKAVWSANYYALDQLIEMIQAYRVAGVLPANANDSRYAADGDMALLLGSEGLYAWNNFNTADMDAALTEATRDSNRNLPQAQQSKVDALADALQTAFNAISLKDVDLNERYACGYAGTGYYDETTGKSYPLCEDDEMHSYNSLIAIIDRILMTDDSENLYTADSVELLRVAIYGDASTEGVAVEVANAELKAPAQSFMEDYVGRMSDAYHTLLELKDADYTNLDALITQYLPGLNGVEYSSLESYYRAEGVTALKSYYGSIDREYKNIQQSLIDIGGEIYNELKGYIDALEPNDADYTDVFYQILLIPTGTAGFSYPAPNVIRSTYSTWINWAKTNSGNISAQMDTAFLGVMYTEASVAALNRVLDGINWSRDIFAQDAVNGQENATSYAKLVQSAREALTPRTYTVTYMVNDGTDAVYTVDKGHEYGSRIGSFPPSNPSRDLFVFKGWSSDPETLTPVSVEDCVYADMVIYAIWGSVYDEVIELVPGEGSTTVIDKDRHYIYGLKPDMTQEELEGQYLDIVGNGRLVIESDGSIGTGTVVKLVSNYTGDVLETYELIIYGDVNGDGMINSTDVTELRMMNARLKESAFNNPYTIAADVYADNDLNPTDVTLLRLMAVKMATIDQVTRERIS